MNTEASILAEWDQLCQDGPDALAVRIWESERKAVCFSRAELHQRVEAEARRLAAAGAGPGDTIAIKFPHGETLLSALLASLRMGAIPCLLPWRWLNAGTPGDLAQTHAQLSMCHARILWTTSTIQARGLEQREGWQGRVCAADEWGGCEETPPVVNPVAGEATACLQLTSGTTGQGRPAELSARAIKVCLERAIATFQLRPSDRMANWLPLYHDLGLFGGTLLPLLAGVPLEWMSPQHFLRRPERLLRLIDEERVSITFATNAALHHLVRYAGNGKKRDLSSLRHLVCGGEPILHQSMVHFEQAFEEWGFDRQSWLIGYGMAESVMGVVMASRRPGWEPRTDWVDAATLSASGFARPSVPDASTSLPMVSAGRPWQASELRIVGGDGEVLGERRQGEIQMCGPYLFNGYRGAAEHTRQVLSDGWLHTGDLGYLADDFLYICGRKSDVINVGGTKFHPEEIEAAALSVDGMEAPGRCVAFGLSDVKVGTEVMVLVVELERGQSSPPIDLEQRLRERITDTIGMPPHRVEWAPRGWIIRTSSGKISRAACRRRYQEEKQAHDT